MSATRDKNQKFTFLYSNLYQIYKQEKVQEKIQETIQDKPQVLKSQGRVLKAEDLNNPTFLEQKSVEVREFKPLVLVKPLSIQHPPELKPPELNPMEPLKSLKKNLQDLTDLHARLKFMLQELEDLVKE